MAAVVLLVAAACGGGEDGGAGEDEPSGAAVEADSAAEGSPVRGDTVEIRMDEYLIDVPGTLPAGRRVLRVRNRGFEEHNLEVHRDSILWELPRPLNPYGETTLEVVLEPGTYRLICTVSGHEGRGMSTEVTVEEAAAASP